MPPTQLLKPVMLCQPTYEGHEGEDEYGDPEYAEDVNILNSKRLQFTSMVLPIAEIFFCI